MGNLQGTRVRFWLGLLLWTIVLVCDVRSGANDKDKEECTEQLVGLATCLPYVGGNAKSPTPDCCSGLKQVLNSNKKCLCVVIKDRNDPDLGLTINVTLALGLPSVCHTPANVTKCPELLHLAPNSTEAQVFYQYGRSTSADVPASSPKPSGTPSGSESSTKRPSSNTSGTRTAWSIREAVVMGVMFPVFISIFLM